MNAPDFARLTSSSNLVPHKYPSDAKPGRCRPEKCKSAKPPVEWHMKPGIKSEYRHGSGAYRRRGHDRQRQDIGKKNGCQIERAGNYHCRKGAFAPHGNEKRHGRHHNHAQSPAKNQKHGCLTAAQSIWNPAKYSLQGTTQGRYLTGGVPPVRFSM